MLNGTNTEIVERRTSLRKPSIILVKDENAMVRSQSVGHSIMKNGRQTHSHHHNTNGKVHYDEARTNDPMRSTLSQPYLNEEDEHIHFKSSHRSISKCGTMSRPDILYLGSLYNIPHYRSTHDINGDAEKYGSFRHIDEQSVNITDYYILTSREIKNVGFLDYTRKMLWLCAHQN